MRQSIHFALVVIAALLTGNLAYPAAAQDDPGVQISAALIDASGTVIGMAGLSETADGVVISLLAGGLAGGEHGVHIHEAGSCDPSGEKPFASAGAHFNPDAMTHGSHAGDLGNLTATETGAVVYSAASQQFSITGEHALNDADGSALVIHADIDDLVTDPSGNSGARIACAVLFPDPAAAPAGGACEGEARTFDELVGLFEGVTSSEPAALSELTIPLGSPADQATVAAVTATIRAVSGCINAGDFARALAHFTDEGIRRTFPWLGQELTSGNAESRAIVESAQPVPVELYERVVAVASVSVLADGRVGALIVIADPQSESTSPNALFIFLKPGDAGLEVDEIRALDSES